MSSKLAALIGLAILLLALGGGTAFALSRVGSSPASISGAPIASQLLQANPAQTFPVGAGPIHVLSAGADIWVANFTAATVTKLRASDGATLGTFNYGNISGLAFDGATLWTSSLIHSVVTRIRPSDGFVLGSTIVGIGPGDIAIDSDGNVWVSNSLSDDVTKLDPAGNVLGTFAVGDEPAGILFDGANIWVANSVDDTLTKLSLDGIVLGTFPVGPPGSEPIGLAFDGTDIWVANSGADNVTKIETTGAVRDTFPIGPDGQDPLRMAFDGANMWVVNATTNNVTKLRTSDGFNLGSFDVGNAPRGIAFDGSNIWVTNQADNTVTKRSVFPTLVPDLVPHTVNFQGHLTDSQGNPIDGTIDVTIRLYDHGTDGPALWGETQSVTAEAGLITIQLGSVEPLNPELFTDTPLWLSVQAGGDPEMLPRQPLSSVPYSLVAATAGQATDVSFTYAGSSSKGGAATDSNLLDGLDSTDLALADHIHCWLELGVFSVLESFGIGSDCLSVNTVDEPVDDPGPVAEGLALNFVGSGASTAIGTDGLPIISYASGRTSGLDLVDEELRVAHCNDLECGSATVTVIDSVGEVGTFSSLAIGTDGFPIISYYDDTNDNLKIAHCDDAACTSALAFTLVDDPGNVGRLSSIDIGGDGFPVISYYDETNLTIRLLHCLNVACTGSSSTVIDSSEVKFSFGSLAVGSDGLPVIFYQGIPAGPFEPVPLRLAHCDNAACSGTTINFIANGTHGSVGIGADGLPLLTFVASSALKVVHCDDVACASFSTSTLDTDALFAYDNSMAIGLDGLPIIVYNSDGTVMAHCGDVLCTSSRTVTLDHFGGGDFSAQVATSGELVVSFFQVPDFETGRLKVARCRCTPPPDGN